MAEDIKCPVCGKVGIPNYHKEDVVCPQCGSDLSIYRMIDSIPDNTSKRNIWKLATVLAVAATICFALFWGINHQSTSQALSSLYQLKDTVSILKRQLYHRTITEPNKKDAEYRGFAYIVRRGDSYCKVSRKLYGTEAHAKSIAENNGKTITTTLVVGDTLFIK